MTDEIEQLHNEKWEAIRELSGIARALSQLSVAFEHTGNSKLAEDLWNMSKDTHSAVETITGSDAKMTHIEAQRAEQASANMLSAAIAGILITKRGGSGNEG